MIINRLPLFFVLVFIIFSCADQEQQEKSFQYSVPPQPELPTGYTEKPGWTAKEFSVAAANPLATDAGYQIIKAGGSAVDAAIAVQLVLTLVEPQSSGIGGGAFMLAWDNGELFAYNGREVAPASADEALFLDDNGNIIPFFDAVRSGKSVGVPGTLALLKTVHEKHGVLPWEDLFEPAITLSKDGFKVSPRLHELLQADQSLRDDVFAASFYYDENGDALPAGYLLKNPALAAIYERVAREGIREFYQGEVAESIVDRVQSHVRPAGMTEEDLKAYLTLNLETEAMCNDYKVYRICGFPPPSSGHLTIMQILGILDHLEKPEIEMLDGLPTAEWLHQFFEASKLAFADRNLYIADPLFVEAPGGDWNSMLDSDYLLGRSQWVSDTGERVAEPGIPGGQQTFYGQQPYQPEYGTSHISIVDRNGNAVSMTTTIESGFGSRIMSDGGTGLPGGFILNNELTDFSLSPYDEDGSPIANRVEPGKRPRSSMSPTIIFDKNSGKLLALVGSPGGAAIIHYTAKAIIGMLNWDLNAQEAINLPNFVNYNGPSILEKGYFPDEIFSRLTSMGHEVSTRALTSGIQAIQVTEEGYFGGADPRREGVVKGD